MPRIVLALLAVAGCYPDAGAGEVAFPRGVDGTWLHDRHARVASERDHVLALQWVAQARGAAHAGRCDEVTRAEIVVRRADPDLYRAQFWRDPAVARCLGFEPLEAATGAPTWFDRELVQQLLPEINAAAQGCSCAAPASVEIRARVAAAGTITGVSVITADLDAGTCVAAAVRATTFPPTRAGGTFRATFQLP